MVTENLKRSNENEGNRTTMTVCAQSENVLHRVLDGNVRLRERFLTLL